MSKSVEELISKTKALLVNNGIQKGVLEEVFEKKDSEKMKEINLYRIDSINSMTNIIKFNKASALSSNFFNYLNLEDSEELLSWEKDREFNLLRFEIESLLVECSSIFLGYKKINEEVYPFVSKIYDLSEDPITRRIDNIEIEIGIIDIDETSYVLYEKYDFNNESKKYVVERIIRTVKEGNIPKDIEIPDEYDFSAEVEKIPGIVMKNNLAGESDIKNVIGLMLDRGDFLYYLKEKFQYLSAKILHKETITDKNSDKMDEEMKEKTFIGMTSKASMYQTPFTIFNPSLPNDTIQNTIKFLEDEIFLFSMAPRPSGTDKKAQTNDLEQATKDQQSHNYMEFIKMLRGLQYTKFMKLIAEEMEITLNDDFEVKLELSSVQDRLTNGEVVEEPEEVIDGEENE